MHINFNSINQGCFGICEGNTFTFPGFLMAFFLIAMNDPIKVKGVEQHNHKRSNATIVEKGTAAVDPSNHKNKSITKKIAKAKLGNKNAVIRELRTQFV